MPRTIDIDLSPEQYSSESQLRHAVARALKVEDDALRHCEVLRHSLDSRRRDIRIHASVQVYMADETVPERDYSGHYLDCRASTPVVIVGAGPAGLFAALRALQLGLRPVIVDRGKPVAERKYDIARITREHSVNPDSNWCFGEGGAGTYSDGKLYTRSTKRGDVSEVLRAFVEHGADPDIMTDAHAHIGTDRLSGIIANIRHTIEEHGGEYHFGCRVTDFIFKEGRVCGVHCADGSVVEGQAVVLATGHSARDIYHLFARNQWAMEPKPFALGVRVEHPQQLINEIQYHLQGRPLSDYERTMRHLPPAAYSLTSQVDSHGVFSFCMCPGGIIVPAASADGEQVVNGMSNSRRNSPFANSGIAVTIGLEDLPEAKRQGPLALLEFQQEVERNIHQTLAQPLAAPIQRLGDFCDGKASKSNNASNYLGTTVGAEIHNLLPPFVVKSLQQGFRDFDRKMHGFLTNEASVLAVESRTSSPVRIPRDSSMQHPQLPALYPCGEGAGYAGGIVSSALDGIRCMEAIATNAGR